MPHKILTPDQLEGGKGGILFVDVEIYPNYFCIIFKSFVYDAILIFELSYDNPTFDRSLVSWILHNYVTVGFNSLKFDLPIIWLAYYCQHIPTLKNAAQDLIVGGLRERELKAKYGFEVFPTQHIDLIEVCPLKGSLKTYGARLHAKKLQDLPFDPQQILTADEARIIKDYCVNDLDITHLVWANLQEQLQLRADMSREYQVNLMSKSDAQMAEAVIAAEIERITGRRPRRIELPTNFTHRYQTPPFIKFKSQLMRYVLKKVEEAIYDVNMKVPPSIANLQIKIGKGSYKLGNGGLHSNEKNQSHIADDEFALIDRDVASYYPAIILNCDLFPKQLGRSFLTVMRALMERRLIAKKAKLSSADGLKITINGAGGKFESKWSIMYSPDSFIQMTLTGQLSLMMLIESIELVGIEVVSANTDGIVIKCPHVRRDELNSIIKEWEEATNFVTEETEYKAVYSRDINCYLAVKKDGSVKGKNAYSNPWNGGDKEKIFRFHRNPTTTICIEAANAKIIHGTDIGSTIRECRDITKFVSTRKAEGSAEKDGIYLGKVIRWYYAKGEFGAIKYVGSGNKVSDTDGAKPLMELPDEFPDDINYEWYEKKTFDILEECSYINKRSKKVTFFD